MVKNGSYSSFAFSRLIWSSLMNNSWPRRKMATHGVPTNLKESKVFPKPFEAAPSPLGTLRYARGPKTDAHHKTASKPENKN
jgi:hypothetical protein